MKKKKAEDIEGWRNEIIIHGGEEMIKSLILMCNRILEDDEIPIEWSRVIIKSFYKNKGPKLEMTSRRGIFLTNLISKVFETILQQKSEKNIKMHECQNGGQKGRSAVDNVLILMAIIDNNRRLKRKTYIIYADAEKCFDKLWLQDCLIDLYQIGMRAKEISLIYKMNKNIQVVIDTPVGRTEVFNTEDVVKQGTIFASQLCCSSTGKVNSLSCQYSTPLGPEIKIQAMVYVDDIAGAGDKNVISGVAANLNEMEKRKGFTFGTSKTNYMIIKTGREKDEEVEL